MKASKIQIGATVVSSKLGTGVITKIITKSTGYVEVSYESGLVKKEMAFNLVDENGVSMKAKPVVKPMTEEQKARQDRRHAAFVSQLNMAVLQDNYFDNQIAHMKNTGRVNADNTINY
jgi:hypothetical protein